MRNCRPSKTTQTKWPPKLHHLFFVHKHILKYKMFEKRISRIVLIDSGSFGELLHFKMERIPISNADIIYLSKRRRSIFGKPLGTWTWMVIVLRIDSAGSFSVKCIYDISIQRTTLMAMPTSKPFYGTFSCVALNWKHLMQQKNIYATCSSNSECCFALISTISSCCCSIFPQFHVLHFFYYRNLIVILYNLLNVAYCNSLWRDQRCLLCIFFRAIHSTILWQKSASMTHLLGIRVKKTIAFNLFLF